MSLTKPLIFDGGFERAINQGDIPGGAEINNNLTTAGAGALTGTLLAGSILYRTGPTGAVADTTDTAANIIAALVSPGQNVQAGTSYRLRYVNTVAFAITLTAGAGVTLFGVGTATINASSVKDFLVTLNNTTPQSISTATTTNGSAVVTGMTAAQTAALSVGQNVAGTGIAGSTTVIGVQPGVGVTLSANATATNSLVALTFTPAVTIQGLGQGLL